MPFYHHLITFKPYARPADLSKFFTNLTKFVAARQGVVRGVENHGVRAVAHRIKAPQRTEAEPRYNTEARFVTAHIDIGSMHASELIAEVRKNDDVLRLTVLKPPTKMDAVSHEKTRLPFLGAAAGVDADADADVGGAAQR